MNPSGTAGQADPTDDPRLPHYADLVEQGGLWSAIVSIARERRLDLGVATELSEEGTHAWGMADFRSRRGAMRVQLGRGVRRFAITLDSDQGFVWASGSTPDLSEVVKVMDFWREGAKLKELSNRFPFMEFDRLSQGYEDGKPVEAQWDILMGDDTFHEYRELLLALHTHPRLREMFPFFSHWTLRMLKSHCDPQAGEILIRPSAGGSYLIWSSSAPDLKTEFDRLDDLVYAAVSILGEL